MGIYFPVYFIISWEDIPPKNEAIGDISALDHKDILKSVFSKICSKSAVSSFKPFNQNTFSLFLFS